MIMVYERKPSIVGEREFFGRFLSRNKISA
jgi:hypothetical protein